MDHSPDDSIISTPDSLGNTIPSCDIEPWALKRFSSHTPTFDGDFGSESEDSEDDHPNEVEEFARASNSSQRRPAVLVMGQTQMGKTTIISNILNLSVNDYNSELPSPGSSMKSCRSWEYKFDSGETLTFIDTPGFGSGIDHREVLQGLMTFLQSNPQLHVIAAVYLYGITSTRLHRTKGRDMDVFCGICGDFFYQNVIFISTHWDSINVAAKSRMEFYERSLCRGSLGWAKMLAKGAKYMRFEGTESSVRAILEACWRKRDHAPPQINLILETRCSGMLEVSTAYAALLDFGTQSTSNALPVVHWTAKDLGIERTWWQFLRSFWSG